MSNQHDSHQQQRSNRWQLLLAVTLCVTALVAGGFVWTGKFESDIQLKRGPFGPVQVGVNGMFGDNGNTVKQGVPKQIAPAFLPSDTPSATPPPYHGPTNAELAALKDLSAATKYAWVRTQVRMSEALGRDVGSLPAPEVQLPARALTLYEIQNMHRIAAELRQR